jgi:hypothetical protein
MISPGGEKWELGEKTASLVAAWGRGRGRSRREKLAAEHGMVE